MWNDHWSSMKPAYFIIWFSFITIILDFLCSILYGCCILFILVPWSLQKTLIFLSLILPRCTFRIYYSAPLYMCKELVLDITTKFRKNDFLTSWMCDRKPVFMKSKSNNLLTKAKKEVSSKYIGKGI